MCPWSQSENQVGRDEIRIKLAMMSIHLHFFQLTLKVFLYLTQHPTKRGRTCFKTRHDAKMLLPSHSVLHENRGCKCVMQKKKWHTDINADHRLVKLQCALKSPPQQWIQCMHGYEVRKYHFIWCCQSYMFGIASWTSSACQTVSAFMSVQIMNVVHALPKSKHSCTYLWARDPYSMDNTW